MNRAARYHLFSSLAFLVLLQAMLYAAIRWWPDFSRALADNSKTIKLLGNIGPVREMIDQIEEFGVYAYIVGQHFFKGCNTLGVAAAVFFSVGAVAGEAHRGTLEILLARPVSRRRILTERYLAGLAALLIPILLTTLTIPHLCAGIGQHQELEPYLIGAAHQGLVLTAFYTISFMLSTLGRHPVKIALILLFFYTFQFAIYLIKHINEYSLFRLADIERFLEIENTRALDWSICGPLLGLTAVSLAASYAIFDRRLP